MPPRQHPCETCHLFQTRGICPPARDVHGLPDRGELEAMRRAIREDGGLRPGLAALIRAEASWRLSTSDPAALTTPSEMRPAETPAELPAGVATTDLWTTRKTIEKGEGP